MTEQAGAVYDLGYEPFEGERRGRVGARRTIFFDGIRRVLGIRRKAKRKVMPWALVSIAMFPPIAAVGIAFLIPPEVGDVIDLAGQNSSFFTLAGTIAMLFTALAAPELLIPDRRDGVLSMLASRPLTTADYLGSRFASLVAVVGTFMVAPQLLLFVGQAGTDPDGLFQGMLSTAHTLPKIAAVAAIYTIAFGPLGFVIASLSKSKSVATASYLVVMVALSAIAEVTVHAANLPGVRWSALIAPINTANSANAWIFGESDSGSLLAAANIHPGIGVVALVVSGTLFSLVALRQYRRLL